MRGRNQPGASPLEPCPRARALRPPRLRRRRRRATPLSTSEPSAPVPPLASGPRAGLWSPLSLPWLDREAWEASRASGLPCAEGPDDDGSSGRGLHAERGGGAGGTSGMRRRLGGVSGGGGGGTGDGASLAGPTGPPSSSGGRVPSLARRGCWRTVGGRGGDRAEAGDPREAPCRGAGAGTWREGSCAAAKPSRKARNSRTRFCAPRAGSVSVTGPPRARASARLH